MHNKVIQFYIYIYMYIYIYTHTHIWWAAQWYPSLYHPMDCSPPGSSLHGDSPGKNIRVGCHALLIYVYTHTHTHIHSFTDFFLTEVILECWVEFPVLCSRFLLVIIYSSVCVNPKFLIYPSSHLPPLMTLIFLSRSVNQFLFCKLVHLYQYLDTPCKWQLMVFVSIGLTSLSIIVSRSIHVATNGII